MRWKDEIAIGISTWAAYYQAHSNYCSRSNYCEWEILIKTPCLRIMLQRIIIIFFYYCIQYNAYYDHNLIIYLTNDIYTMRGDNG